MWLFLGWSGCDLLGQSQPEVPLAGDEWERQHAQAIQSRVLKYEVSGFVAQQSGAWKVEAGHFFANLHSCYHEHVTGI